MSEEYSINMRMYALVELKDETDETYEIVDVPSMGDFLVLYLSNLGRIYIAKEDVKRITLSIK